MTERDIKIAAFKEAIDEAKDVEKRYGSLPGVGIRSVIGRLEDKIRDLMKSETVSA